MSPGGVLRCSACRFCWLGPYQAADGVLGTEDVLYTSLTLWRTICVDGGRQAQHQHQDIPLHSSPDSWNTHTHKLKPTCTWVRMGFTHRALGRHWTKYLQQSAPNPSVQQCVILTLLTFYQAKKEKPFLWRVHQKRRSRYLRSRTGWAVSGRAELEWKRAVLLLPSVSFLRGLSPFFLSHKSPLSPERITTTSIGEPMGRK